MYFEGTTFISEKEPVSSFVFEDKLDSNLEFVSISFLNGSVELECEVTYEDNTIQAILSETVLKDIEGKALLWKMTCNYIGEEKPTQTVTIPNTATVSINDDMYTSNEVKAYVSMVTAYEVTQTTTTTHKTATVKPTKQAKNYPGY